MDFVSNFMGAPRSVWVDEIHRTCSVKRHSHITILQLREFYDDWRESCVWDLTPENYGCFRCVQGADAATCPILIG